MERKLEGCAEIFEENEEESAILAEIWDEIANDDSVKPNNLDYFISLDKP